MRARDELDLRLAEPALRLLDLPRAGAGVALRRSAETFLGVLRAFFTVSSFAFGVRPRAWLVFLFLTGLRERARLATSLGASL